MRDVSPRLLQVREWHIFAIRHLSIWAIDYFIERERLVAHSLHVDPRVLFVANNVLAIAVSAARRIRRAAPRAPALA